MRGMDSRFNMLAKYASMWTCRHLWAVGACFAMNLYRHFSRLIVRAEPGNRPEIILSWEAKVFIPARNSRNFANPQNKFVDLQDTNYKE